MAIYAPGTKFRNSRILSRKGGRRDVVAILSLTAMVDMFTVLVVFLLQNYNTTGEVLFLPKEIVLPKAESIRELQPSVVVTISKTHVMVDKDQIIATDTVRSQEQWQIPTVAESVKTALAVAKENYERRLQIRLQKALDAGEPTGQELDWSRVTVQADKDIEMLTVKKVMLTVIEAGASQINFAVTKEAAN